MGKVFAILGDIHANVEALDAVLADCRENGVTDFLCTGDVVGYGAAPHECMEKIREIGCPVVMGNHDQYVSSEHNLLDFNPNAAAGIAWTRDQLTEDEFEWLRNLPFTHASMGIALVHATMDNPSGFGYVFDHLQAEANFARQQAPLCFHGHTHCPVIYEKQMSGIYRIDAQSFKLPIGRKYFINVGSVGQPRDCDPRASYAIYDTGTRQLTFRRVDYDIETAQDRIRKAGLPERLAARLAVGQ